MAKKNKKEKLPTLTGDDWAGLNALSSRPEFRAFEKFLRIEKNNIGIIGWFRIKSSDPDIKSKKAQLEGRFAELDIILQLFREAKKKGKGDE